MIPSSNYSIRSFCGGYYNNFCYLITCSQTGIQILIDASINIKKIKPFISNQIIGVLITHSHGDHIKYLDQYLNNYPDLIILGHEKSSKVYKHNFKPLKNNLTLKIGELVFKSIYTPGHYFDSVCFQLEPILLTGDTMFVGRTGRVISKKSNLKDLYKSIYQKILKMPLNTRIFPGHHYGKSSSITLKKNIEISPLLQAKNFKDFQLKMEQYELNRNS